MKKKLAVACLFCLSLAFVQIAASAKGRNDLWVAAVKTYGANIVTFESFQQTSFGNPIGRWGSFAAANAMQSSSMPGHKQSGLIRYPYRAYEPNFHRWISADRIGERGGLNLHRFVYNNPLEFVDTDGLAPQLVSVSFDLNGGNASATYAYDKFGSDIRAAHAPLNESSLDYAEAAFAQAAQASYDPNTSGLDTAGSYLRGVGFTILGVLEVIPDGGLLSQPCKVAAKKAAGKAARKAAKGGMMNPNAIRFSQDSIRAGFKDTTLGTIDDLAAGLKSGTINPGSIEPIRLVEREGNLISIDNRRLEAFRRAGADVPTRMASPGEIQQAIQQGKFSAGDLGGATIRVRGE